MPLQYRTIATDGQAAESRSQSGFWGLAIIACKPGNAASVWPRSHGLRTVLKSVVVGVRSHVGLPSSIRTDSGRVASPAHGGAHVAPCGDDRRSVASRHALAVPRPWWPRGRLGDRDARLESTAPVGADHARPDAIRAPERVFLLRDQVAEIRRAPSALALAASAVPVGFIGLSGIHSASQHEEPARETAFHGAIPV